MAAKIHNITIEQGASYTLRVRWKAAGAVDYADLSSGYTAAFTIREGITGDVWLQRTSDAGQITLDADGWIETALTAAETAALQECVRGLVHVLSLTETDTGTVRHLITGPARLLLYPAHA